MRVKKQQLEMDMKQLVQNWERSRIRLYIATLLIKLICRVHHVKCLAGIKITRRNINNLRYADDTTLMAENEEELKSLLLRVKEEGENAGLKLSIKKTKIMASSPIMSWQIEGEKVEAGRQIFFSWAPKSLQTVTAAIKLKDACSFEGKL